MRTTKQLTDFEASYMETALWSTNDNAGLPLDSGYHDNELVPETIARIKKDCTEFEDRATAILNEHDYCSGDFNLAHDFWLTRNRHGAGFWDGNYPEPLGQKLTALAHSFGEVELYIGDDSKLYFA